MSLSEKRYIGQRIGAGVFATTDDVDHGFVDAPLLNGGRYRAQRLASGVYAAECNSSYELLPVRQGGIKVGNDLLATKKCRMAANVGVRVVLFVPRWLTDPDDVRYDYAIYGDLSSTIKWDMDKPLILNLYYSHASTHITWPGTITVEPTNNNQQHYGSFRSHLPAGLSTVLKVTLSSVSYDTSALLFDIINGNHYLYPAIPIQGPDPIGGTLGGSSVLFYWDVNPPSTNVWGLFHNGGDFLPPMVGWRALNLPRFEFEAGARYNQSNPPVTDPDNYVNYCLAMVNSKGDIVHYATGQIDYATTSDAVEVTFVKDENSSFSLFTDTVVFHGYDNWPDEIDATLSNMYASILFYGTPAVYLPGTVGFTLSGLNDAAMNGTHTLDVLARDIGDITAPPFFGESKSLNVKDNGPALNGYLIINLG